MAHPALGEPPGLDQRTLSPLRPALITGSLTVSMKMERTGISTGRQRRILARGSESGLLSRCATEAELDTLFMAAVEEMAQAMERFRPIAGTDEEMLFQHAMLSRQILSAVIDGDRRDTAEFCLGISIPHQVKEESAIWQRCLRKVENRLQSFTDESEINQARRTISDRCKRRPRMGAGIYRLNIPTGEGKRWPPFAMLWRQPPNMKSSA